MSRRMVGAASAAMIVAVAALTFGADSAMASDLGKRVGDEVKSWSEPLLLSTAGVMTVWTIATRDGKMAAIITGLSTLSGAFVLAPGSVKNGIETVVSSVLGG